jgi:excisionase family DNA binding protein
MTVDLEELAKLPTLLRQLQERVRELEAKLAVGSFTEPLLDVKTAAEMLGMTPTAVRTAAYRGSIKCVRVGRRLRFRPSDLAL